MNQPAKQAPANLDPASRAIATVNGLFKQHQKAIEDALPKHVTAVRMMRVALTELRRSHKLQKCDPLSFLGSIVQASQLGLEPGGALGHCYLIPYGAECTLQIGYRGQVDLARRSGNISSLSARVVYDGDEFKLRYGTDEGITHEPMFKSSKPLFVYAVAQLRDGGTQFDVMSIPEVNHIRDTYSAGFKRDPKTSPWTTAYDEMAKKTIVRRLFKMLPTSIEIRDAISIDEDEDQHNAKLLDPNHEVIDLLPDPIKAGEISLAGANDHFQSAPAMEAERSYAIEQFTLAISKVKAKGGNPDTILNAKALDLIKAEVSDLLTHTDILDAWLKDR